MPQWDIEIFAARECTRKPEGFAREVWVLLGRDYLFGEQTMYGSWQTSPDFFFIFTPSEEEPNESYQLRCWRNFLSDERNYPFRAGTIVRLVNDLANVDVTDLPTTYGERINA